MKLSRPVIIINAIQPICMWEEHYDYGKQIGGHVALVNEIA